MRYTRQLSPATKAKISQGVRQSHAKKTEVEKQQTRAKQSAAMRKYWETIPKNNDENDDEEPVIELGTW